jgi:hypothetical protein
MEFLSQCAHGVLSIPLAEHRSVIARREGRASTRETLSNTRSDVQAFAFLGDRMATFWRNLAPATAILISLAAAVFSGLR